MTDKTLLPSEYTGFCFGVMFCRYCVFQRFWLKALERNLPAPANEALVSGVA